LIGDGTLTGLINLEKFLTSIGKLLGIAKRFGTAVGKFA